MIEYAIGATQSTQNAKFLRSGIGRNEQMVGGTNCDGRQSAFQPFRTNVFLHFGQRTKISSMASVRVSNVILDFAVSLLGDTVMTEPATKGFSQSGRKVILIAAKRLL